MRCRVQPAKSGLGFIGFYEGVIIVAVQQNILQQPTAKQSRHRYAASDGAAPGPGA